jgi:hypothetical protein
MKHATTLKMPKTTSNKRVDPDNPPWSEEMLGPPVLKRGRGPQKAPTKVLTTVRLDPDVLAFFKARGLVPSATVTVESVVDMSFAEAAVKELGPWRRKAP